MCCEFSTNRWKHELLLLAFQLLLLCLQRPNWCEVTGEMLQISRVPAYFIRFLPPQPLNVLDAMLQLGSLSLLFDFSTFSLPTGEPLPLLFSLNNSSPSLPLTHLFSRSCANCVQYGVRERVKENFHKHFTPLCLLHGTIYACLRHVVPFILST